MSTQPCGEGGAEGRWCRGGKLEEQRRWPGVFWLMTSLPLDEHSVVSGGRVFRWRRVKSKKSGRAAGREGNLGGKGTGVSRVCHLKSCPGWGVSESSSPHSVSSDISASH